MERYSVFLDMKDKCCENDYTTKCNLQIQCNSYQITNGIFHRTRTKNFTIHMETQRPWTAKAVLRKKNGARVINLPDSRLYYKAIVIKAVWYWLAWKQKYISMEQVREPRDKPMHLWVPYFWQRRQNIQWGKDSLFKK